MLTDIKNACIDNASSRPAFGFMLFMFSTANIVIIFLSRKTKAEIFYFSAFFAPEDHRRLLSLGKQPSRSLYTVRTAADPF